VPDNRLELSLVIPAYNEAHRLPPYLAAVRSYLDARYRDGYEVLVVDDGSNDGLGELLVQAASQWPRLRTLKHAQNQGKGAAVRTGVLAASGARILFADADGATPIEEEARLAEAIQNGADLAVGSRLVAAAGVERSRSWARGLAGRLFAAVARRLLGLAVRDTQCGFKMFRAEAAQRLFSLAREPRYLFDLEVLALAAKLGYRIAEVPVRWKEIAGGHLSLVREVPKVLRDLWRLYRRLRSDVQQER
jgi:dolichyl-phosphate beta-glucosyltransferase